VFYSNLEIKKVVIVSEIKEKKIVVNESLFTSITSLKSEDARIVVRKKCSFERYNKIEFYYSLCQYSFEKYKRKIAEKDNKEREILAAGPLFSKHKLLHFFLNWVLVPKGSNHKQYSDFELQLMYGIKNGLKIDWPFEIKSNLVKFLSQGDLPYPIFISRLINHFDVDVTNKNVIETTIFDQRIGISSSGKL